MPIGRGVLAGKPKIASGQRDCRVLIEQRPAPSGGGFPVENWTPLDYEWMSRTDQAADERNAAGQTSAFAQTSWQMRYREDMDPDLVDVAAARRLRYGVRTYDIRSATPIGRRDGLELITLARAG